MERFKQLDGPTWIKQLRELRHSKKCRRSLHVLEEFQLMSVAKALEKYVCKVVK